MKINGAYSYTLQSSASPQAKKGLIFVSENTRSIFMLWGKKKTPANKNLIEQELWGWVYH